MGDDQVEATGGGRERLEDFVAPPGRAVHLKLGQRLAIAPGVWIVGAKEDLADVVHREVFVRHETDPGPGIAPFMHAVVDKAHMASYRDALPGGPQVRLGRDGILEITEVVADVGEDLHQGDAQVGHVPLLPVGHDQGQAVQDQLAKACVVLGEVADFGFGQHRRRTRIVHLAVDVAGARRLEGKIHGRVARVHAGHRLVGRLSRGIEGEEPERVRRVITRPIDAHIGPAVLVAFLRIAHGQVDDLDVADVRSSVDPHVRPHKAGGR